MKHYVRLVLALILCCLFTVGCSSGVRPDKVVRQYLDAWIASDYDTVAKLLGQVNSIPKSSSWEYEFMKSLLARDTYKVGTTKVEGETAEVAVTITAVDCQHIAARMGTNVSAREFFSNAVSDPEAAMVTSSLTLKLDKKDDSWTVKDPGGTTFVDAMTGGMDSVVKNWLLSSQD